MRYGFWVSASQKSEPHAPDCTRMASLPDYRQPINQPRYPLVRKATLYLDDITGSLVFSELEQLENGASGMVPLYAARVQDLGPEDMAVFKCGACGHTAELWPTS